MSPPKHVVVHFDSCYALLGGIGVMTSEGGLEERVPLWDAVKGKRLLGICCPMRKDLVQFLRDRPNFVL